MDDLTLSGNASYELPNYTSKHQVQGDRKGGGVSNYIHKEISNNNIESLSAEIVSDKVWNTIVNVLYKPKNCQIEPFETFLNNTFSQIKVSKKPSILLAILI